MPKSPLICLMRDSIEAPIVTKQFRHRNAPACHELDSIDAPILAMILAAQFRSRIASACQALGKVSMIRLIRLMDARIPATQFRSRAASACQKLDSIDAPVLASCQTFSLIRLMRDTIEAPSILTTQFRSRIASACHKLGGF